ncbi:hypothetical protein JKP88DRAFT_267206 [Tribonema minus]|uniref:Uncharacterized protein n=1 Tax=Tribonema minus TaxID=303371 RepID=A0A835ZCE3_9STRA|nr:hypothetical protein JKP88DRAFT_267206 [Tribonema minus]
MSAAAWLNPDLDDVGGVALKWNFRGLHRTVKAALESLVPRLDAACELDEVEALNKEIEWRRQLLEACEPCVDVYPREADVIMSEVCEEPHSWRFYSCYLAYHGITTWQHLKVLHGGSATLADLPEGLVTCLLDKIQELERDFAEGPANWLFDHVPELDHDFGDIFYEVCEQPQSWRFYSCYLAYHGVTTWQDLKVLHRGSAILAGLPEGLVTCLLEKVQELERDFAEDLAALAPSRQLQPASEARPSTQSATHNVCEVPAAAAAAMLQCMAAALQLMGDTVRAACNTAAGACAGCTRTDHAHGFPCDERAMHAALASGDAAAVRLLLFDVGSDAWDGSACVAAAAAGDLTSLALLHATCRATGGGHDEDVCVAAAAGGYSDAMRWARGEGCAWDACVCAEARTNGHLGVLKWAVAEGCPCGEADLRCLS